MYINPKGVTKEQWLEENGVVTSAPFAITETHLPVCLVQNERFSAAGVGYVQREIDNWLYEASHGDTRPRTYYVVPREKLREVCSLWQYEQTGKPGPF